jgi:hypothetical protein
MDFFAAFFAVSIAGWLAGWLEGALILHHACVFNMAGGVRMVDSPGWIEERAREIICQHQRMRANDKWMKVCKPFAIIKQTYESDFIVYRSSAP